MDDCNNHDSTQWHPIYAPRFYVYYPPCTFITTLHMQSRAQPEKNLPARSNKRGRGKRRRRELVEPYSVARKLSDTVPMSFCYQSINQSINQSGLFKVA